MSDPHVARISKPQGQEFTLEADYAALAAALAKSAGFEALPIEAVAWSLEVHDETQTHALVGTYATPVEGGA